MGGRWGRAWRCALGAAVVGRGCLCHGGCLCDWLDGVLVVWSVISVVFGGMGDRFVESFFGAWTMATEYSARRPDFHPAPFHAVDRSILQRRRVLIAPQIRGFPDAHIRHE